MPPCALKTVPTGIASLSGYRTCRGPLFGETPKSREPAEPSPCRTSGYSASYGGSKPFSTPSNHSLTFSWSTFSHRSGVSNDPRHLCERSL